VSATNIKLHRPVRFSTALMAFSVHHDTRVAMTYVKFKQSRK
jgi:hypothetical protein